MLIFNSREDAPQGWAWPAQLRMSRPTTRSLLTPETDPVSVSLDAAGPGREPSVGGQSAVMVGGAVRKLRTWERGQVSTSLGPRADRGLSIRSTCPIPIGVSFSTRFAVRFAEAEPSLLAAPGER